jgi:hypothetical protein
VGRRVNTGLVTIDDAAKAADAAQRATANNV